MMWNVALHLQKVICFHWSTDPNRDRSEREDEVALYQRPKTSKCCDIFFPIGRVASALVAAGYHSWSQTQTTQLAFFENKLKKSDGTYHSIKLVTTLTETFVLVVDPKLIRAVLKHPRNGEGEQRLFSGGIPSQTAQRILGDNLLTYPATEHLQVRKAIAPHFNSRQLKEVEESIGMMIGNCIGKWIEEKIVFFSPVKDLSLLIVECVAKSLLKYEGSIPELYAAMEQLLQIGIKEKKSSEELVMYRRALDLLGSSAHTVFLKRKGDDEKQPEAGILCAAEGISTQKAEELARLLFFAGFDTTSSWIEYLLHTIGQEEYLHWQAKIFEEWTLSKKTIIEFAHESSLLDRICQESLRLHPPAFVQTRVAQNALRIGGMPLPKGAQIHLLHYFAGRNKAVWGEDAEIFNPDRRHTADLLFPFSHGPTACLGKHFAVTLTKIFLVHLINQVQFISKKQPFEKTGAVALKLQPDVEILITRRKKS